MKFFEPCHDFISEALEKGENVMVHCLAGAHRAGTTGVSYMMRAGNLKYSDARRIAKQRRSVVDPFANLEQLLIRLEKAYLKYDFANYRKNIHFKQHVIGISINMDDGELKFSIDGLDQAPIDITKS